MIVENPDALKTWLTSVLEPLCDADPAALAKYVYALVKKDKPLQQLKESMVEQLEVFLQNETKRFVALLFVVLEKQDFTFPVPSALQQLVTVEPPSSTTETENKVEPPIVSDPQVTSPTTTQNVQPAVSSSTASGSATVATNSTAVTTTSGTTSAITSATTSGTGNGVASTPLITTSSTAATSANTVQINGTSSLPHSYAGRSSHRKSDSDREDKERSGRARHRGTASPSRNRSRSRSWERSRRSRSRDRLRDRDRSRWRNKSPPTRRYERDRRRSWSRTRGGSRSRSRSRSPRHGPGYRRYRRSPLGRLSLSRSRSHSMERKKEPLSGGGTPTQDSNHGDVDMRLNTTTQSIQSVVSQAPKRRCMDFDERGYCMRGDLCPYDHGTDPVVLEDVSVLPYEGAPPPQPMVGPPPPPPGGVPGDMGVMQGGVVNPAGPGMMGGAQPPPPMVQMGGPMPPFHHHMPRFPAPPPPVPAMEYNPDAPSMEPRMTWSRVPTRGGGPGMRGRIRGPAPPPIQYTPMQQQRELVSVPLSDQGSGGGNVGNSSGGGGYKRPMTQDNNQNYPMHGEMLHLDGSPIKRRPGFDYGRLGPRTKQMGNCSLQLKKVPRGVNNITHLNNHFAKFGKIVNIQVNYNGDVEAALVTFSSHAEANAAYRSTEAVLNNRFIKVFWHNENNNEGKQENVPPPKQSVKDRLGAQHPAPMQVKVLNTKVDTQPNEVQIEEAAAAAAAMKKMQEVVAAKQNLRKKQEEKRREAIQLTADLCKRKQELLDKQLEQQKQLIQRLEKPDITKEQRQEIVTTIKSLQQSVENIRKDIAAVVTNSTSGTVKLPPAKIIKRSNSITKTSPPTLVKTKEEAQREILDAELDLIAKQQEGGDTAELQKKVALLKMEAANQAAVAQGQRPVRGSLRTVRGRGIPRTRATYRIRNRVHFAGHQVDHRPSKLLISGYEEDDKAEVLEHFAQFGEIVDHESDDAIPSLILNYKSRKEAEKAMSSGRNFGDRLLSITWHAAPIGRPGRGTHSHLLSTVHLNSHQRQVMMVGDPGDELLDDAEVVEEDEEELVGLGLEAGEDALLLDDEEEDEDGEDRSWRR